MIVLFRACLLLWNMGMVLTGTFVGINNNSNFEITTVSEQNVSITTGSVFVNGINLMELLSSLQRQIIAQQATLSAQQALLTTQQAALSSQQATLAILVSSSYTSCTDVLTHNSSAVSGVYRLHLGPNRIASSVWCNMVAGEGWALALKIDGSLSTFNFDNTLWTDATTFNEDGGTQGGLDAVELKSPLFSSYSFTQMRVGMRPLGQASTAINWITQNISSSSLLALLKQPQLLDTTRAEWCSLVNDGCSLQQFCNKIAISFISTLTNALSLRMGLIANNEADCGTPDSFVGFGGKWPAGSVQLSSGHVCGSSTTCDRGPISTPTFGYVLLR
jgi:hypothetical protein